MRPQAIALNMAPKDSDTLLRFFDTCPAYAAHEKVTNKWLVRTCNRAKALTHYPSPSVTHMHPPDLHHLAPLPRPPGWRPTGLA